MQVGSVYPRRPQVGQRSTHPTVHKLRHPPPLLPVRPCRRPHQPFAERSAYDAVGPRRKAVEERTALSRIQRHPGLVVEANQDLIFVFDSPEPSHVTVYRSLEWARESLESLDVLGDGHEAAFRATGQFIRVEPSEDLFAAFEMTEQVDLERLTALLRQVRGSAHLADGPRAYAQEWIRQEYLDAERSPVVPEPVWSWYRRRIRSELRR